MPYYSKSYRHRSAKAGTEEQKTKTPFLKAQKGVVHKRAVQRKERGSSFIQPKLTIGQPGDVYEKEADAVAGKVANHKSDQQPVLQEKEAGALRRRLATSKEDEKLGTHDARMEKDKEEPMKPVYKKGMPGEKDKEMKGVHKMDDPEKKKKGVHKMDDPEKKKKGIHKMDDPEKKKKGVHKMDDPEKKKKAGIHKKEDPKKKKMGIHKMDDPKKKKKTGPEVKMIRRKEMPMASAEVSAEIEEQAGKGRPLPEKTLAEMNHKFGMDFSHVRIHTEAAAVRLCVELNAQAFTHGCDIYFNEGKFNPESEEGRLLLAHELTHVAQQYGGEFHH